jgi:phosphatidate cytidylyltransferase
MLITRIVSSILILSLVVAILFFAPAWCFMLLAFVFCAISIQELLKILNITTMIYPMFYFLACFAVLVGSFYNQQGVLADESYMLVIILSLFLLLFINIFRFKKGEVLSTVVAPFLAVIYVTFLLSYTMKIRMLYQGQIWFLYLISVVKIGDVGAFMFGRKIGKHKLIPAVSPNKTVEGAIAGFFSSILMALALIPISEFTISQTLIIGSLLAFLGQAGDLIESLIKRVCSVKDAGDTIPGFGGLLDVIDSLLFTGPVLFWFLKLVKGL